MCCNIIFSLYQFLFGVKRGYLIGRPVSRFRLKFTFLKNFYIFWGTSLVSKIKLFIFFIWVKKSRSINLNLLFLCLITPKKRRMTWLIKRHGRVSVVSHRQFNIFLNKSAVITSRPLIKLIIESVSDTLACLRISWFDWGICIKSLSNSVQWMGFLKLVWIPLRVSLFY